MAMKERGDLTSGLPPDEQSGGGDIEPRPGLNRAAELELVDAAVLGDAQAFAELFGHYRLALYGLCCNRLKDLSLAEDVVQEVFIKAFESLPGSDHRKPIWPWLATIALRMCVDLQRRRSFIHYSGDIGISVDTGANKNVLGGRGRSALDEVIASEESAELWKSVGVLPERQRRALLLYAFEGLSYEDIAAAEGISVGAVKLLLVRARRKMRHARQNGKLAPVLFPFTWLGWKFQRIEERARPLLNLYHEGFLNACVQAACLSALVTMVVAAGQPASSFGGGTSIRPDETVRQAAQPGLPQTALLKTAGPNIGASANAPSEPQQSVAGPTGSLVDEVINPNQNATPEDTRFRSIAASPNYESDHTILALGEYSNPQSSLESSVLFASRDGGGTWEVRPSRLLDGYASAVILPPDFPQDERIFVFGVNLGLQQSDDGGDLFRTVSPAFGGEGVAISPLFRKGSPIGVSRILMGGATVREYDANTGVTSAFPTIPPIIGSYSSIAFSPNDPSGSTVLISDTTTIYRCKGLLCDKTQLPYFGPLSFRFSSRCDQAPRTYAFTPWKLIAFNEETQTFEEIQFPIEFRDHSVNARFIPDMAVSCSTSSDPVIFVNATWIASNGIFSRSLSGVYRSFDAGRSWSKTLIDLPTFDFGAKKLIITPTGRLLATGFNKGIACSVDLGLTWAPRCPPPKRKGF